MILWWYYNWMMWSSVSDHLMNMSFWVWERDPSYSHHCTQLRMDAWPWVNVILLLASLLFAASCHSYEAAVSKGSFEDNFSIMWSEDHFTTSKDGQIWYLSLDNDTGTKCNQSMCHIFNLCMILYSWRI